MLVIFQIRRFILKFLETKVLKQRVTPTLCGLLYWSILVHAMTLWLWQKDHTTYWNNVWSGREPNKEKAIDGCGNKSTCISPVEPARALYSVSLPLLLSNGQSSLWPIGSHLVELPLCLGSHKLPQQPSRPPLLCLWGLCASCAVGAACTVFFVQPYALHSTYSSHCMIKTNHSVLE